MLFTQTGARTLDPCSTSSCRARLIYLAINLSLNNTQKSDMKKAIKKAIPLTFCFASEAEDIHTLEGVVTARPGDAVLTGTKGERWPIRREKFEATYDFNLQTGICSKKAIVVEAEEMQSHFEVKVGWSNQPLQGGPGDFKITYGPGEFGVVAKDIFHETYDVLSKGGAPDGVADQGASEADAVVVARPGAPRG